MEKQIILGVDPGTAVTGYGVIQVEGNKYQVIDYGCIKTKPKAELPDRYLQIYEGVTELIQKYKPDAVSVETQFVQKNVQSAIKLGMARASVVIASRKQGVSVFEYSPRKAKSAVVGNGGASKEQVQGMVKLLLKLKELPKPEDASDALALAICHSHQFKS